MVRIIESIIKQIRRERIRASGRGTYIFEFSLSLTAGSLSRTINLNFSPIYFSRQPAIFTTHPISVRVLEFKKKGNAISGAVILITGSLTQDTTVSIYFEGVGGVFS